MTANKDASPLQLYIATVAEQEALCDHLEAIADALPDGVDRSACLHLARTIPAIIGRGHALEESVVFPTLEDASGLDGLDDTVERLRFEHFSDDCYAEELSEALIAFGAGRTEVAPATLGYMLRGFFEGLRRHLAFERAVIMPLLKLR